MAWRRWRCQYPLERARLYFKYAPRACSSPRTRGGDAPIIRGARGVLVENESEASWAQGKVTMGQLLSVKINPPGSCHGREPLRGDES